jgi:hypothetical protein
LVEQPHKQPGFGLGGGDLLQSEESAYESAIGEEDVVFEEGDIRCAVSWHRFRA